jgi:hypothetical protein
MKNLVLLAFLVNGVIELASAAPPDARPGSERLEQKTAAAIAVVVRAAVAPALGVPLEVSVLARSPAPGRLAIEAHADGSVLTIASVSTPVDEDGGRRWIVTVVPMRESGGNLSLVVAGDVDGVEQAKSVVFPVRLPGAAGEVRAQSVAPARADGENLSLLPVEERF